MRGDGRCVPEKLKLRAAEELHFLGDTLLKHSEVGVGEWVVVVSILNNLV